MHVGIVYSFPLENLYAPMPESRTHSGGLVTRQHPSTTLLTFLAAIPVIMFNSWWLINQSISPWCDATKFSLCETTSNAQLHITYERKLFRWQILLILTTHSRSTNKQCAHTFSILLFLEMHNTCLIYPSYNSTY